MNVITARLPKHECPVCHAVHNAGTIVGREIKPGDVSLCFECGTMSTYTETGTNTPLSHGELLMLIDENPEVLRTMMAWVKLKKERMAS